MNKVDGIMDMKKKLAALAEKYQCAIVLVGHMKKASGNKTAYQGMGLVGFFVATRSVLLADRVEEEENTKDVVQIKNNLLVFLRMEFACQSSDSPL